MLPHTDTHTQKSFVKAIIPKASPAPNGSIEEKLKNLGKCPNTAAKKKKKKKKNFSTSKNLTKVP